MAASKVLKSLVFQSFVVLAAAQVWGLTGVAAQPDPATEPAPGIETQPAPAIDTQPAPDPEDVPETEIEDDFPPVPQFDDDFADPADMPSSDPFEDDFGTGTDDFLNELPFDQPGDDLDFPETGPAQPGPGDFRQPGDPGGFGQPGDPGGFGQPGSPGDFRPPPFGLRDEVDMPAREIPEDEETFGLDLTRDDDTEEVEEQEPKRATIRALEKITARITDLEIDVGATAQFKALMITVRTCNKRPPEEPPETTAFLEVLEQKPNGDSEPVFAGWMFASSPGLSALEHPVYDVWVIDCITLAPLQSTGIE